LKLNEIRALYKRGFFFRRINGKLVTSNGLRGLAIMYENNANDGSASLVCEISEDQEFCNDLY